MYKFLTVFLLLYPLSVVAEWRYDGRPAAGGSATQEVAMAQPESPATAAAASAGPAPGDAPRAAMTMPEVRASRGEPERIFDPVGDPPITRWQYPGYVVYFENDRVITSVAGRW